MTNTAHDFAPGQRVKITLSQEALDMGRSGHNARGTVLGQSMFSDLYRVRLDVQVAIRLPDPNTESGYIEELTDVLTVLPEELEALPS